MILWNNVLWEESLLWYSKNLIFTSDLLDFLIFEKFNLSSYETSEDRTWFVIENHNLFDTLKNELTSFQQITRDWWVVTDSRFTSHSITLDVWIVAKTTNELLEKIQELKRNIYKKNWTLQVNFWWVKKKTIVNVEDLKLPRNFYWERLLISNRKWSIEVQMTRLEHWEEVWATYSLYPDTTWNLNLSLYIEWDSEVYPRFVFNFISWWENISKIEIDVNWYKVSYTWDFSESNRLEFDFKNEKIMKDVIEVYWEGRFLPFNVWVNNISIDFTSSWAYVIEPQIIYNKIIL